MVGRIAILGLTLAASLAAPASASPTILTKDQAEAAAATKTVFPVVGCTRHGLHRFRCLTWAASDEMEVEPAHFEFEGTDHEVRVKVRSFGCYIKAWLGTDGGIYAKSQNCFDAPPR